LIPSRSRAHLTRASVAAVALVLLLAACGSSSKNGSSSTTGGTSGGSTSGSVTLNGSGSTFQKTFDDAARQAFSQSNPNITVNYAGGGSGKGKTDLASQTVDWAGTDSTIKPADLPTFKGGTVLYFPTVSAPITVSYNLSGVSKLQLSGPTLAKIFTGKITKWNDAAIAADNTGVTLPSTNITIAHRAEASGTTSNFTKFLASASPSDFTQTPGDTVNWPANSQAGQGNTGVAQIVKQNNGAVGYVDYSDAVASGLKFASIKNKAGEWQAPTLDGAAAAVANSTINADLTYNPINVAGTGVYPITSPTWVIIYAKQTDKNKGTALKEWVSFLINGAQSLAKDAKYAPLPASLQQKANAQLSQIQIPA
jgi:phosphate transport system substrate-binding protein